MFTGMKIVLDFVHLIGDRPDDLFAPGWQLAKIA